MACFVADVHVFILKELGYSGWRPNTAAVITAEGVAAAKRGLQEEREP